MRLAPIVLLGLAACTVEHGKIPVVDEVTVPASATLDADGTYHVDATVTFHDDDDNVRKIRVTIESLKTGNDYPITSVRSATNLLIPVRIVGSAPKGETELRVQAIDLEGNVSDPKSVKVTLR